MANSPTWSVMAESLHSPDDRPCSDPYPDRVQYGVGQRVAVGVFVCRCRAYFLSLIGQRVRGRVHGAQSIDMVSCTGAALRAAREAHAPLLIYLAFTGLALWLSVQPPPPSLAREGLGSGSGLLGL